MLQVSINEVDDLKKQITRLERKMYMLMETLQALSVVVVQKQGTKITHNPDVKLPKLPLNDDSSVDRMIKDLADHEFLDQMVIVLFIKCLIFKNYYLKYLLSRCFFLKSLRKTAIPTSRCER